MTDFGSLISNVFAVVSEAIKVKMLEIQPRICDHKAFYQFVEVLKKIKNFMNDVSNLTGWKKYASAISVKETFEKLISEFDRSMDDLHFTVTIFNEQQRKLEQENLNADIKKMEQFLKTISGGVTDVQLQINTVISEIQTINKKMDRIILKVIKINPKELDDPPYKETNLHTIIRKLYRGNEVECKPTNIEDEDQRIQAQLVILGKLKECPNVLKFYGLSNLNDRQVMVFEWAEKGNLKELYKKHDINWDEKVHIALDICRGLVFIHSCGILHHDIRCENIMMTMRLEPKIANFIYSRETDDNTTFIKNEDDIVRWMSPEKISKRGYDFKCEIFSFGMLLWELTFEKIPYEDISNINQIKENVTNGIRERINFGPTTPEHQRIQNGLKEIIIAEKQQDRILLVDIFNKLYNLSVKCDEPHYQTSLYPDGHLDLDGSKFNKQLSVRPLVDGVACHKNKDYETAWKIFEYHAGLGSSTAKFWKARYLADGIFVDKNVMKAADLFKEAAEDNNTDACFRYALLMTDKSSGVKFNRERYTEYLTKAASAGDAMAQYHLGNMYLEGKHADLNTGSGIKYLKLAALNGHLEAEKALKERGVNINE
ncbi:9003_t:CDS:2 [Gigaspora margarita]|uniref:9003_t:CDS:1 n=1 Tax=Gigaspora margarita TaxID=4874 RepID=A0ABM8W4R7_GIGMA|nr:9003_t:CDS:2 [Gigaspora margarita]